MLEPTKKSPSALSLIPNPNPGNDATIARSTRSSGNPASTLIRSARRKSVPSLLPGSSPSNHTPLNSSAIVFRAEPESPVSLHEWQRSINDRIKTPFPTEIYQSTPSPPPPVPKVPYGIVNMYAQTPIPNINRNTTPTSLSHKSLSQSVTSNLSAALSSVTSSVTSPSIRRKSRALSPSEMKRVRDMDQPSLTSADSTTPPTTAGLLQGHFDDDPQNSLNAEKVLEQAMRHHQQRRNQQRFGGPGSLKSKASTISAKDSTPSSPAQTHTSPAIRSSAAVPAMRMNKSSPQNSSVTSFEVLIKELEEEEEERKRKIPVSQPPKTIPQTSLTSPSDGPAVAQPRPKRPNALNEAKRRSTGSILFSQPLTPTLPIDKENSSPFLTDRKTNATAGHQARRISGASFGSKQSDSKRNSAHELAFNFVDWSGLAGGCATLGRGASKEYSALVRNNSVFGEFDESRRYSSAYNFGRRGSVF